MLLLNLQNKVTCSTMQTLTLYKNQTWRNGSQATAKFLQVHLESHADKDWWSTPGLLDHLLLLLLYHYLHLLLHHPPLPLDRTPSWFLLVRLAQRVEKTLRIHRGCGFGAGDCAAVETSTHQALVHVSGGMRCAEHPAEIHADFSRRQFGVAQRKQPPSSKKNMQHLQGFYVSPDTCAEGFFFSLLQRAF